MGTVLLGTVLLGTVLMGAVPPWLSAAQMSRAFAKGTFSPVEAAQTALARIDAVNPTINAIYHLDVDAAMEQARAAEARWQRGAALGPLDGIPTTVKDAVDVTGMPAYRGSAAGQAVWASADHPVVARMRAAGMVFLGKNTMCDYGILAAGISSRHGVTRNPWNPRRTTGASSSGAAASVAAGIEPVSIGTDIVGSIRVPAAYCGLAGLKPSQGRVPYYFPISPSLVAGPLARCFEDVALMMNVLTGPDSRDFTALPRDGIDYLAQLKVPTDPPRALVVRDLGIGAPTTPDMIAAVERAADVLRETGATIEQLAAPPFTRGEYAPAEAFYMTRTLSELERQPGEEARKTPVIWDWTRPALAFSAVDHHRNWEGMQRLRERAHALIDGFDFVLMPSVPGTAFDADAAGADPARPFESWANTFLFNLTEQPAANVPVGLGGDGLPLGVQVLGRRFDDLGVLRLAWQLETASGQMPRPVLS
ncbi:MAG: amidase family protein [Pseudomonadota bacterium]